MQNSMENNYFGKPRGYKNSCTSETRQTISSQQQDTNVTPTGFFQSYVVSPLSNLSKLFGNISVTETQSQSQPMTVDLVEETSD